MRSVSSRPFLFLRLRARRIPSTTKPAASVGVSWDSMFRWLALFLSVGRLFAVVELRSQQWVIAMDPADLSASARLPDGRIIAISTAQGATGAVADLVTDGSGLRWRLPARHVSV